MNATNHALEKIFNARSIAIVGASADPKKLGHMTLNSIIKGGYEGQIFPVNPKGGNILGYEVYTSIKEIPEQVDLVVVLVPAKFVPAVLREAKEKGVPGAVVLTAGFREAGRDDLENELKEIVNDGGPRIVGPNVQGINFIPNKLCAMFFPLITLSGPLAIIAQSGSVTAALSEWAVDDGMGICAAINLGNQTDLNESDYLTYLSQDDSVGSVALYLEGLGDGRSFMDTMADVTQSRPVVVLKSGKSEVGKKAAASHTGSLAGSYRVFNAALKQSGGILADSMEDLYDKAQGAALIKSPSGPRILSIATSGGMGARAADAAEEGLIEFPSLSNEFTSLIGGEGISELAHISNPLDLGYVGIDQFVRTAILADKVNCADIILLNFGDPMPDAFDEIIELNEKLNCSLVISYCGGGDVERRDRKTLQRAGIPVFPNPERALRGIKAAVEYSKIKANSKSEMSFSTQNMTQTSSELRFVPEFDAIKMLDTIDINYPIHNLAKTVEEAGSIAEEIGYPVVMKIVSPDIEHKSDVGGVAVGLKNTAEVHLAYDEMMNKMRLNSIDADISGVLVCKQAEEGTEVIIGALRDPVFGPTVMFGLGGVFAEVFKDTAFRVAPFDKGKALEMISEIKGIDILKGARSRKSADLESIADLLVQVGELMLDYPNIVELDLNPVRVYEDRLASLDVRIFESDYYTSN